MGLEEKVARARIIAKFDRVRGSLFRIKEYFVKYRIIDAKSFGVIYGEKIVNPDDYTKIQINEEFDIKLFSLDSIKWYTDRKAAEKSI